MAGTAELYRTIFDALDEGFCVIEIIVDEAGDAVDYVFVEVNAAFEAHSGLRGAQGKRIRELVPEIEPYWIDTYGRVARTGEPIRFEARTATSDTHVWFDEYAFRLGGPESRRVAVHFTDITERKRAEREIENRVEHVGTLIEKAPVGVLLIDPDLRLVDVNPAARPVFGGSDPVGRDYAEILRRVWPSHVAERIVAAFRRTLETGEPYHEPEMAEVRADRGVMEYYDWRADRILLPDGRHGIVCYFSDITAQIETRRSIAASEERYRTLFDSIDEGFCILEVIFDEADRPVDYRYVEINPVFEGQTGMKDALGRTIRELVPDIEAFWFDAYGDVALTGQPRRFVDHAESMGRWFDVYAFRIGDPRERKVAVLFNDITERKRAEAALVESEARLRHRAQHDALTGLPNRQVLEDRLRCAIAAAGRRERPLAVLFIDIDGFKAINDAHGHAVGDVVLERTARRMRAALRAGDTLARLHGDEFVVLLPEVAGPLAAKALGHALRAEVAKPIDVGDRTLGVSASIGVSLYPRDARDATSLLRAADLAMYRAKVGGKNDVCEFQPSMCPEAAAAAGAATGSDGASEADPSRIGGRLSEVS